MGLSDNLYNSLIELYKIGQDNFPIVLILSAIILAFFLDLIIKRMKSYVIHNKIAKGFQTYQRVPFIWQSMKIIFASVRIYIYVWILLISFYYSIYYSGSIAPKDKPGLYSILFVFFIITVTLLTANILAKIIHARAKILASTSIFISIVQVTVYLVGLLVILTYLHQDITWLIGTLGIAGLAVALALQDTLANFFAGLYIIASRQIKPGHYIKLDSGEEGVITDVNWRSTTIQALANHIIIIPNSKIGSAIITNYHLPLPPINVYIAIGVHYESNLKQVEQICIEVAREIMKNPILKLDTSYDPIVRYNTFADSSINFNVIMRALEYSEQFLIKHEYIKAIHERFNREGITIPYPIRTIEFATDLKFDNSSINQ